MFNDVNKCTIMGYLTTLDRGEKGYHGKKNK